MTDQPQEISKRISDLTVRLGAEMMRSLQRYHEMVQRVASGELDDETARDAYVRCVRDETERYFLTAAHVSAGYYDAFLELASIYNPPFFERAFTQRGTTPTVESRANRGVIVLRGTIGDEAHGTFRIDSTDRDEEVAFVVSEFSGPPGAARFRPPLQIQPPRFVLRRRDSQRVSIRLPLIADLFVVNQRYVATLTVQKREAFELTIEVLASAPLEAAARQVPHEAESG